MARCDFITIQIGLTTVGRYCLVTSSMAYCNVNVTMKCRSEVRSVTSWTAAAEVLLLGYVLVSSQ